MLDETDSRWFSMGGVGNRQSLVYGAGAKILFHSWGGTINSNIFQNNSRGGQGIDVVASLLYSTFDLRLQSL